MRVQNTQKKAFKTNRVKTFNKKIDKKTNQFPSIVLITFLGVSRRGEFENTIKTNIERGSSWSFFASDPPTRHGVADFVLAVPSMPPKEWPKKNKKKKWFEVAKPGSYYGPREGGPQRQAGNCKPGDSEKYADASHTADTPLCVH
jgi:hypothetical protein